MFAGFLSAAQRSSTPAPVRPPATEPPPRGSDEVQRDGVVSIIETRLSGGKSVAVLGKSGLGKTIRARQVFAGTPGLWRSYKNRQGVAAMLEEFAREVRIWFATNPPKGAIVVLDDVPLHDRDVADIVRRIESNVRSCGACLLVTTNRPRSAALGSDWSDYVAPAFTTSEILDLMTRMGAPLDRRTRVIAEIVGSQTAYHPEVVTVAVRFLQEQDWQIENFEKLFAIIRNATTQVADESIAQLRGSVSEESLELLTRFTVPVEPFPEDLGRKLAEVDPAVVPYRSHFDEISGEWVSRDADRLEVNSKLRGFDRDLAPEVRQACHLAVALHYLRGGAINAYQALFCVAHLLNAHRYDQALGFYRQFAQEVLKEENPNRARYAELFLAFQFPEDLTPWQKIARITVRLPLQISLDQDYSNDLQALASPPATSNEEDRSAQALAFAIVVSTQAELPFSATARLFMAASEIEQFRDSEVTLESVFVIMSRTIRTVPELRLAAETIRRLDAARLDEALRMYDQKVGTVPFDGIWFDESDLDREDQDWSAVLAAYEDFAEAARQMEIPLLRAVAANARAVILGEYLGRTADAVALCDSLAGEFAANSPERVFVEITAILQLGYKGLIEEAERRLARIPSSPWSRRLFFFAYLALMAGVWRTDLLTAISHADAAIALTEPTDSDGESIFFSHDRIRAYGERATLAFLSDGVPAAWPWISRAAREAFDSGLDAEADRARFVQILHTLGYFWPLAEGEPPPTAVAGGGEYMAPTPGMYTAKIGPLASTYSEGRRFAGYATLLDIASALGDEEGEEAWEEETLQASASTPRTHLYAFKWMPRQTRRMIEAGQNEAAFRAAWQAALLAGEEFMGKSPPETLVSEAPRASLELTGSALEFAQEFAATMVFAPFVLAIGRTALNDPAAASARMRAMAEVIDQGDFPGGILWTDFADTLRQGVDGLGSLPTLNAIIERNWNASATVASTAMLVRSLQPTIPLPQALADQISAGMSLPKFRAMPPVVSRRLLLPFLEAFWDHALTRQRVLFRAPDLTREAFDRARQAPAPNRLRQIALASSVGVNLPTGF